MIEILKNKEKLLKFLSQIQGGAFWSTLANFNSYMNPATVANFRYVVEDYAPNKLSYRTALNSIWVQNGVHFPKQLSSTPDLCILRVSLTSQRTNPKKTTPSETLGHELSSGTRFSFIFQLSAKFQHRIFFFEPPCSMWKRVQKF